MMQHYTLEGVNPGPVREGKYGDYHLAGILIQGQWYNGFTPSPCPLNKGSTVELELSEEEYNGKMQKKFRLPKAEKAAVRQSSPSEGMALVSLTQKVKALEERINMLEIVGVAPTKTDLPFG